jgi:hypothetical protein
MILTWEKKEMHKSFNGETSWKERAFKIYA